MEMKLKFRGTAYHGFKNVSIVELYRDIVRSLTVSQSIAGPHKLSRIEAAVKLVLADEVRMRA